MEADGYDSDGLGFTKNSSAKSTKPVGRDSIGAIVMKFGKTRMVLNQENWKHEVCEW